MTKNQWIEEAMALISVLVQYYPSHLKDSEYVLAKVYELQNARFEESE